MSTETELQAAVKTSAKKDSRKKGKADLALFARPLFFGHDKVNARTIRKHNFAAGVTFVVTLCS